MIINPFVDNSFQLLWPQQVEERCCLLQACVVHIVTSTGSLEVCQSTSFFKTHFKLEYVFFFLQDGGYFSVQSGGQECCCPRQLDPPPPSLPWQAREGLQRVRCSNHTRFHTSLVKFTHLVKQPRQTTASIKGNCPSPPYTCSVMRYFSSFFFHLLQKHPSGNLF